MRETSSFLERVALNLGGPLPVFLQLYYDSALLSDGVIASPAGLNWQHNYDLRLHVNGPDATVAFRRGKIIRFAHNGAVGTSWIALDIGFQLREQAPNFVLMDPRSQFLYTFDAVGLLTQIEDGRGNVQTLSYTGSLLDSVTDGIGRTITFSYDGSDRLIGASDGVRSVSFGHSGSLLTSFTDADNKVTTYTYDPANPSNPAAMTARMQPEGNKVLTNAWDASGRVMSQTDDVSETTLYSYGDDLAGRFTIMTDPLGHTLGYFHNENGELVRLEDQAGEAIRLFQDSGGRRNIVQDRRGESTSLTYDSASGLPTRINHPGIGNDDFGYTDRTAGAFTFKDLTSHQHPDGRTDQYAYDASGNLMKWTLRDGDFFTYTHNARGQVETVTNPTAGVATYTYDANGRLDTATDSDPAIGVTDFTYDGLHRLTQIEHPDTNTVTFGYDPLDRLTSVSDERSNITRFEYDGNGRLTKVIDAALEESTFEYDDLNRLTRAVDRLGHDDTLDYDERGLVEAATDRNGNTTTFQYDERQRLTGVTDPGGKTTSFTHDLEGLPLGVTNAEGETTTVTRDEMGYVESLTNPLGETFMIERDAMKNVNVLTDPLGRETTFLYNLRGILSNAAHAFPGSGNDLQTTYTYDDLGRLTNLRDPELRNWGFTHSPLGRLASSSDPLLQATSYQYDSRGRLSVINYPDASTATFTYDPASNVTDVVFTDGTHLQYGYDSLNRLGTANDLEFTYDPESRVTNTKSSGVDFGASYDPGGRLATVTYPDPGGFGSEVTVTYQYDTRDRLTQVSDDLTGTVVTFGYDDANRLTGMMRPNGVHTTYTYDDAGRITRVQEGLLADLRYRFDAAGQLIEEEHVVTPLDPASGLVAGTTAHTYDGASQVSTAGYVYDSRGRLTASPGHTHSWDGVSRLRSIDAVTLTYNGLHDLLTRTEAGNTTRYFYNAAIGLLPAVAERDEGTMEFRRYNVWSPGGLLLYFVELPGPAVRHAHFNRAGATIALTDASGAVSDAYAYDAYGRLLARTGSSTQPCLFGGRFGLRHEPAAGLVHMRARYYDPETARFLSREPIWPNLEVVQANNPYQYAYQDPLNFGDPTGEAGSLHELTIANMLGNWMIFLINSRYLLERRDREAREKEQAWIERHGGRTLWWGPPPWWAQKLEAYEAPSPQPRSGQTRKLQDEAVLNYAIDTWAGSSGGEGQAIDPVIQVFAGDDGIQRAATIHNPRDWVKDKIDEDSPISEALSLRPVDTPFQRLLDPQFTDDNIGVLLRGTARTPVDREMAATGMRSPGRGRNAGRFPDGRFRPAAQVRPFQAGKALREAIELR